MARAILICTALSAEELRRQSHRETGWPSKRMQAIAHSIDGFARAEAARLAGMEEQALTDAIKRYTTEGFEGLYDREHPGRPPKLDDAQREELRRIVLAGPDVEKDGLSSFTRDDIALIIKEKWNVTYDPTSVGRILRDMKLSWQKARPTHPKKDPEAAAAFSKNAGRSAPACRYT